MVRTLDRGEPHRRRRIAAAGGDGSSGAAAAMEGSGLGFAAGNGDRPGADKEKGEGRVKGRHGSRRWPARGAEAEDGRRRATRAGGALETERGREEAADRWARRGFSFSFFFFFSGL